MGLPEKSIELKHKYSKGKRNLITDVPGVTVGHVTIDDEEKGIHTGVSAVLPHQGNLFQSKVSAGVSVLNGFGKSAGLVQIEELGTLEAPIVMTNTLSVGTALTASVKYMLARNPEIGGRAGTVNCVVTECNDGKLNDIRGLYVTEFDVLQCLENTGEVFEEGAVGAGRGMTCLGYKGGIGSASRLVECDGEDYVIGVHILTNFGIRGNLRIDGERLDGQAASIEPVATVTSAATASTVEPTTSAATASTVEPAEPNGNAGGTEKGSCIIIIATDIPLSDRQLRRVAKRSAVGLARTGSYLGNGSGDIALAFSTGNRIPHDRETDIFTVKMFHDEALDKVFEATAEAVEEAVLSSLWHAETVCGFKGRESKGLRNHL